MSDLTVLTSEELVVTAVRRRLVGSALRQYRQRNGYALEDAAAILECDRSKISRIETGQRGIRRKELRELLEEYGIGESEQATLSAIADPRRAQIAWWEDYADIVPAGYPDLMIMEMTASEIMIYDAQQIPELLQTRDYARAVAESGSGAPEPGTLDRLAEMNAARQQVIMNQCTAVTAVIGEAALRQQVGNLHIVRDQIRWLTEISSTYPWVTLQVLPFESGTHPKCTGPMSILRYADALGLGMVHLRGLNGGICLTSQTAIAGHIRAFTQLQASALPPHRSAQLIREIGEREA